MWLIAKPANGFRGDVEEENGADEREREHDYNKWITAGSLVLFQYFL